MLKYRPSRISIPSFSLNADKKAERKAERQSVWNSKTVSRRASIRVPSIPQVPVRPASPDYADEEIDEGDLFAHQEPLFHDKFIQEPAEPDFAPPSAVLAAKWNTFLESLSQPASPVLDQEVSDETTSKPDLDEYSSADEASDVEIVMAGHVAIATPTTLTWHGKPRMIDISPSNSVRSSRGRGRSSSIDSASSRYSDASATSSGPGTPLSSAYGSDHNPVPGSCPLDKGHGRTGSLDSATSYTSSFDESQALKQTHVCQE